MVSLSDFLGRLEISKTEQDRLIFDLGVDSVEGLMLEVRRYDKKGVSLGDYHCCLVCAVDYLETSIVKCRGELDDILTLFMEINGSSEDSFEHFFVQHVMIGFRDLDSDVMSSKATAELEPYPFWLTPKGSTNLAIKPKICRNKSWKISIEALDRMDDHDWEDFRKELGSHKEWKLVHDEVVLKKFGIAIPAVVFKKLELYQRDGINWIISRFHGDKIGGKTRQVLASIFALIKSKRIRRPLVACPPSVIGSWAKEIDKLLGYFDLDLQVLIIDSSISTKVRKGKLKQTRKNVKACNKPLLIITSISLLPSEKELHAAPTEHRPDFFVLDEAHKAKNHKTQLYGVLAKKTTMCSPACFRLAVTATPMENDIEEFYNVFNWATAFKVLDRKKHFMSLYGKGIQNDVLTNASLDNRKARELQCKVKPYLLQRTVKDHLQYRLPPKKEFFVLVEPSKMTRTQHAKILQSFAEEAQEIGNGHVFSVIHRIRRNCSHPVLGLKSHPAYYEDCDFLNEVDDYDDEDENNTSPEALQCKQDLDEFLRSSSFENILRDSTKLTVGVRLVGKFVADGHKMLVFFEYRDELEIFEYCLLHSENAVRLDQVARLDGTVRVRDRNRVVDALNDPHCSLQVLLVMKKVGGLGLTLTGADRVVIFSPSWNPCVDSQAVGRAYRIGQEKPVEVFRLIGTGILEEWTMWKQAHKISMIKEIFTTNNIVECMFTKEKLSSWSSLMPLGVCESKKKFADCVIEKPATKHSQYVVSLKLQKQQEHEMIVLLDHQLVQGREIIGNEAFADAGGNVDDWKTLKVKKRAMDQVGSGGNNNDDLSHRADKLAKISYRPEVSVFAPV